MSVLVLMYHRTPGSTIESDWDVPLAELREQALRLRDQGYSFISFSEAAEPSRYSGERYACLTFDDGHRSNLDAFELLQGLGVASSAFIISDRLEQPVDGFVTAAELAAASHCCEFGGHGASHADLASMADDQLLLELTRSRTTLEAVLGRSVTTMSAPGGRIDRRVVRAAEACGYRAIGGSRELINRRARNPLNRICVRYGQTSRVLQYAAASQAYWLALQTRQGLTGVAARLLGEDRYAGLRRFAGR